MATNTTALSSKKKKSGLISAIDIMKGWTTMANTQDIYTLQPWQCIPLKDKTEDWIKWNAEWYEAIALRELPKKAKRLQKLYNLAVGIINKSDYIEIPQDNDLSTHLDIINNGENEQTLLNQFFPIVPNIIQVFMGEQIKRDKAVIIQADDPESQNEVMNHKMGLVEKILMQQAISDKQAMLFSMGITEENPATQQQYQQEMQTAAQLIETETRFKKFRTIAEQWAQKFVEKFGTKNYFDEKELYAFADSLIADEAIFCLNMRETDFDVESLRPLSTYVNQPSTERYYSKSNAVVNVEFMSLPDIVNMFRNDLKPEQVEQLEQAHMRHISSGIQIAQFSGRSEQWYDTTKSYDWNAQVSLNMKQEESAKQARDFLQNAASGTHYTSYSSNFNNVKLTRVSRIWWPSQRKVGLLTKFEEGNPEPIIEQVDENFVVTEFPVYDNSLLKDKTAQNLIKGEHIDWTWAVEWRYVVKIGQNVPMSYKFPSDQSIPETIYLYGQPIMYQFKGEKNIYEAKPPIEGCRFSNLNTPSVSLVERLKPWQILYNVLNNKVLRILPHDYGKMLVLGDSYIKRNSLLQEDGLEPVFEMLDSARETHVLNVDDSREAASQSTGRLSQPTMIDMSTIDQVALHLQTARFVKGEAFESLGFSPQRMAQVGTRETATGVQQGREASENQTEMHFEQFSTFFIPRVWQMIIEAGQYYTEKSDEFSDMYLNSETERQFFSVLKGDLTLRQLFVTAKTKADVKKLMSDLKQLIMQDNTMGATFLDKVKTFTSKSPTEIIEKLHQAEYDRQQEIERKYKHEQELQQNQEAAAAQRLKEEQDREDVRHAAELENERYIAELNTENAPAPPDTTAKDMMGFQKLQNDSTAQNAKLELEGRKIDHQQQQHKDNIDIKREEIAAKDRKNQTDESIAIQNKSYADIKFQQLQKNKTK